MVETGNNENTGHNENTEKIDIDWQALDDYWPEQYQKDYGHLFEKK